MRSMASVKSRRIDRRRRGEKRALSDPKTDGSAPGRSVLLRKEKRGCYARIKLPYGFGMRLNALQHCALSDDDYGAVQNRRARAPSRGKIHMARRVQQGKGCIAVNKAGLGGKIWALGSKDRCSKGGLRFTLPSRRRACGLIKDAFAQRCFTGVSMRQNPAGDQQASSLARVGAGASSTASSWDRETARRPYGCKRLAR